MTQTCPNCGKSTAAAPYTCSHCGWQVHDCPTCGGVGAVLKRPPARR